MRVSLKSRRFGRKICFLAVSLLCLITRLSFADLAGQWSFATSCPSTNATGDSGSLNLTGPNVSLTGVTCTRSLSQFLQILLPSGNPYLTTTSAFALQTSAVMVVPPFSTSSNLPVFSVNAACPTKSQINLVWIYTQLLQSGRTDLSSASLMGTAVYSSASGLTITGQYRADGSLVSAGQYAMGGTCTNGDVPISGLSYDLNGDVTFNAQGAGIFHSANSNATFFFPQANFNPFDMAYFGTLSGISFDTAGNVYNVSANYFPANNNDGSFDGVDSQIWVSPLSDPQSGQPCDSGACNYVDTLSHFVFNSPAPGMGSLTINRVMNDASGSWTVTGGFIIDETGSDGFTMIITSPTPGNSSLPYNLTLSYKPSTGADPSFNAGAGSIDSTYQASPSDGSTSLSSSVMGGTYTGVAVDVDGGYVTLSNPLTTSTNGTAATTIVKYNTDGSVNVSNPAFSSGALTWPSSVNGSGGHSGTPTAASYNCSGVAGASAWLSAYMTVNNNPGTITPWSGNPGPLPSKVLVQADGKYLVSGAVAVSNGSAPFYPAIWRTGTNSALDTSYGTGGITVINVPNGSAPNTTNLTLSVSAMVLQSNGKLVVALSNSQLQLSGAYLIRLNADGTQDTSFNNNCGVAEFGKASWALVNALAVAPDGSIYAGGAPSFSIYKYSAAGVYDKTYGGVNGNKGSGASAAVAGQNGYATITAMAVDGNGKVMATGTAGSDSNYSPPTTWPYYVSGPTSGTVDPNIFLVRMTTAGALDTTFGGGNGYINTVIGLGSPPNYAGTTTGGPAFATGLVIQSDGKIVVTGDALHTWTPMRNNISTQVGVAAPHVVQLPQTSSSAFHGVMVVRYNPDGTRDSLFSPGTTFEDPGVFSYLNRDAYAYGVAIDQTGKIVVVGGSASTGSGNVNSPVLLRIWP